MDSELRTRSRRFLLLIALTPVAAGCSPAEQQFPLRPPVLRDTDVDPVYVACREAPTPKDPRHVTCAPDPTPAAIYWDGLDNLLLRPLSETVGIVASGEAVDVNSLDEVPDSSWFTNRIGSSPMTPDEISKGACTPSLLLDGEHAGEGAWVVDKGKMDGSTDGFRVNIPHKGKYLFKADDAGQPERPGAAQVLGSKVFHAAGYPTTCEQIVYFKPETLKVLPGLKWKHNFDDEKPLDRAAVDSILAHCPKRGDYVRMTASAWLPGYNLGAFEFHGTRSDDPNDVIPHEDRRELRGLRLLDAWIDRFDERSGNTLDMWMAEGHGAVPDASPGHVVHYHLDTSETLGSEWAWDPISRRLGYSYVADWSDIGGDFVTFGIRRRTWDTIERTPGHELFGYFNVRDFVPEDWKNGYPVASFSRMTERDGAWMARILARFTPDDVRALARVADFHDAGATAYLEGVLEGRLRKILERYLLRLSPIADVRVESKDRLCGVDLAEARALRGAEAFHYAAHLASGDALAVERRGAGTVCALLPPPSASESAPGYVRVLVEDGIATGALVASLYDLGPRKGYFLAGIER
jgi:hypothetical protein